MLSSQIVQTDFKTNEFANRHSALNLSALGAVGAPPTGGGFAAYLADALRTDTYVPAGTILTAADSDRYYSGRSPSPLDQGDTRADQVGGRTFDVNRTDVPARGESPVGPHDESTASYGVGRDARSSSPAAGRPDDEKAMRTDAERDASTHSAKAKKSDDATSESRAGRKHESDESANSREKADDTAKHIVQAENVAKAARLDLGSKSTLRNLVADATKESKSDAFAVERRLVSGNVVEMTATLRGGDGSKRQANPVPDSDDASHPGMEKVTARALATQTAPHDGSDRYASTRKARERTAEAAVATKERSHSERPSAPSRTETVIDVKHAASRRDAKTSHHSQGDESGKHAENANRIAVKPAAMSGQGSDSTQTSETSRVDGQTLTHGLRADGTLRGPSEQPGATQQPVNLRQALADQLNGEIVRSARLVIRGDSSGEIRMHLKPEDLGNVRIALQMHDGHVAGRIIVDNQSVRDAFEQNLAALQRAFQEAGLDATSLEVSLADDGNSGTNGDEAGARNTRRAVATFDAAVPAMNWLDDAHELVDVTV